MGIEMNACNPAPGRQRQREWEEVEASLDTVSKVNKQGAVTIHKPHKPPKQRTGGQGAKLGGSLFSMYRALGPTPSTKQYQRGERTVIHLRHRCTILRKEWCMEWAKPIIPGLERREQEGHCPRPGDTIIRACLRNNKTKYCTWLNFTSFYCGCGSYTE